MPSLSASAPEDLLSSVFIYGSEDSTYRCDRKGLSLLAILWDVYGESRHDARSSVLDVVYRIEGAKDMHPHTIRPAQQRRQPALSRRPCRLADDGSAAQSRPGRPVKPTSVDRHGVPCRNPRRAALA